jgi:hypothetical protein
MSSGRGTRVVQSSEEGERIAMTSENAIVAIYDTHSQAEEAIQDLQRSGFDMKKLSIVGKGYHTEEHAIGYYNTGDRMKHWGKLGAFWGSIWGLLVGTAFFFIPGIGPVLVGGPMVAWIVAALEGAVVVGGVSAIGAGLISLGIPKDRVIKYEFALKADRFLVVAHGTAEEIAHAKDVIATTRPVEVDVHEPEKVAPAAGA